MPKNTVFPQLFRPEPSSIKGNWRYAQKHGGDKKDSIVGHALLWKQNKFKTKSEETLGK